jgi:AcrR family transcriptional regulator
MPARARARTGAAPAAAADGTRELILAGAARLFREHGYAATTLRQIADAAGIQAGSIYYHFGSKDEILLAVLDEGIRAVDAAVRDRLARLPAQAPHRERIACAIEGHLHGLLQRGDFTSANIRVYGQIPGPLKARHRVLRQAYAHFWDDLLLQARESGELRGDLPLGMLRLFLIGALNWTVEWYTPRRGGFGKFTKAITDVVFEGILAPQVMPPTGSAAGKRARPRRGPASHA